MAQNNPDGASSRCVLVIDDSNFCRELVVEALRGHGYATLSAADGEVGIAQLQQNRVDAVILDNEMPKMNGLQFLKAIRQDARWQKLPVVMLTTNVSKEVISEAMSRKISGYLLKAKFSMPEMLSRVHTAVMRNHAPAPAAAPMRENKPTAAAPAAPPRKRPPELASMNVPNLVPHDAVIAAATEFKFAKTLSGIASEIASIAASARPAVAELAAVIRQDPILAARVVNLAAAGKTKSRLANIDDAVRAAGVDAVRDLAASFTPFTAFPEAAADGLAILRCWQHALATAAVMARIVPKTDAVPPGLPHLIGLCHDLAEIMLRLRFPAEFSAAADFASQAHVPVIDAILPVFGASCFEITDALLQQLKFPAAVADPIKEFIAHAGKPIDSQKSLLARTLAIADAMANGMLFASSPHALVAAVSQNDCRSMLIPTSGINFAEIRSESSMSVGMLANPSSVDMAAFSKPLLGRDEINIWYMRHTSFAQLDPIEIALSSLASSRTYDRLPVAAELAGVQGLIILAPTGGRSPLPDACRLRSQAGKPLPILHIAPAADAGNFADVPDVEEVSHIVPLHRLAEFTSGLKAKSSKNAGDLPVGD